MRRARPNTAAARVVALRADRLREGFEAPRAAAAGQDALSVSLFGAVSASFRGKPVDLKLRKGAAVLAYLCLQENFVARRDRLAFLLWSESDGHSARTSLRQTLIVLRKAFQAVGYDGLRASKLTISLDPERLETDVQRIHAATGEGRIDEALLSVEHLPETLLEGLEDVDEEFSTWLRPTRQALHNRLETALSARLDDETASEPVRVQAARALLHVDPTNETALRHEVLFLTQRGDVAGAVRTYRRYEQRLLEEYSLKPGVGLQILIHRIQREIPLRGLSNDVDLPRFQDDLQPVGGLVGASVVDKKLQTITIRLDKFSVQGIDSSQSYLVTAFRHTLTASLVRFREWVILDGGVPSISENPRIASADYVLQTTLYQVDGGIEVVLTLLRMQDTVYLWSQIINLQLDRWLATQHEIIRGVAATLQINISAERLTRAVEQPLLSTTAFDQWLRAQEAILSLDVTKWRGARDDLNAVIRENPTYAPLSSSLAQLGNLESLLFPGVFRNIESSRAAIRHARRAVQLDPLDSRAHLALGWALAFAWDFEAARTHMRLAVELNESDPWPNVSAAQFWAFAGEREKTEACLQNLRRRSKSVSGIENTYFAQILFLQGDYDRALAAFERFPAFAPPILAWKAAAMALIGRAREAELTARDFVVQARKGWTGPYRPTEETIVSWVLQAHPVRDFAHWSRLREGLRLSRLPVGHVEHAVHVSLRHAQNVEV